MFQNIFSFDGRIRRTEYWLTGPLIWLVMIPITMAAALTGVLLFFIWIVPIWLYLAAAVKRSHDMGNSGWLILVPIYNPFILAFGGSQSFTNQYGPNPKGLSQPIAGGPVSQQVVVNNYVGDREAQKLVHDSPAPVLPSASTEMLPVLPETATLQLLNNSATVQSNKQYSDTEKINNLRQLKELLDSGILTQEEFDHQKNKILNNY